MNYQLYIMLIICIILFTLIAIIKGQWDKKQIKIKEQELLVINKNLSLSNLNISLIWFLLFIVWSILFITSFKETYDLLNKDYLNSIFQLFNFQYLEELRRYFFDNNLIRELSTTVYYLYKVLNMLTWTIGTLCISIFHFYTRSQNNVIYEKGILNNGKMLSWDKIIHYSWSDYYQRKVFQKGRYYDLILTLPKVKLIEFDNEIKIRIDYDLKERVNEILEKYTNSINSKKE